MSLEVVNLDTDAFGGAPPRGAGFQPPDLRRDAQRVDAFRLVRAAHAAALRALAAYMPALEEVVALLLEKGDVSGEEVRRAIENNPPVAAEGGKQNNGEDEDAEFPDLEAIFRQFRFDEGFVPEEEEREDWIEDERKYEEEGLASIVGDDDNDDELVDDGDGSVSALPAPEDRREPVRPRATSPAAIREGLGAAEPASTALQAALADAVEEAQTFEEIGEEEGREEKFWADLPVEEMKLWTM